MRVIIHRSAEAQRNQKFWGCLRTAVGSTDLTPTPSRTGRGKRRFTRLTNAFSKKLENHIHALSIYFMQYNFFRIHQTLRCSPAMEADVTARLWALEDIIGIVDESQSRQNKSDQDAK